MKERQVAERLKYLRYEQGWKWWIIAASDEFHPIPIGTLSNIMKQGKVPKKWWERLGIEHYAPPRIAISKTDADKAVRSIMGNINDDVIQEIAEGLYLLDDGFGNVYERYCPECHQERQIVRPGKIQCVSCEEINAT